MPSTTHVSLGASTVNSKWYIDINTGSIASPVWLPIMGVTDFQFTDDAGLKDDSDFDAGGFGSQTKTKENWGCTITVARKVVASATTTYDPGQEALRAKAIGKIGSANSAQFRFYEMNGAGGPKVEAYMGQAAVAWSPNGGPMDELSTVALTLAGQGLLSQITHPDAAAAVPTIFAAYPSASIPAAGGKSMILQGTGFTGTTGITVGGTAGTGITVVNDGLLTFDVPAKAAGSYPVVVTNATGPSTVNVTVTYV